MKASANIAGRIWMRPGRGRAARSAPLGEAVLRVRTEP